MSEQGSSSVCGVVVPGDLQEKGPVLRGSQRAGSEDKGISLLSVRWIHDDTYS